MNFYRKLLDQWKNFLERVGCEDLNALLSEEKEDELRDWASFRGQTLSRTGITSKMVACKDFFFFFFLSIISFKYGLYEKLVSYFSFLSLVLTVRGMMYYKKALKLQAFLDLAEDEGFFLKNSSEIENYH